jgi:hypothetical protein
MVLLQTGDPNAVSDNAALIGALVALGGVFTAQMVSIALDDRRNQEARDLEAQRAHEAALQNYFEDVGELLIEQPLRRASPGDNLSTVVRAQTLSVLEGLDPERKRLLLQFLYESGLVYGRKPVVSLEAGNLRRSNLRRAYLSGANLSNANLRGADLTGADLSEANLGGANLIGANLIGANLIGANLRWATLIGADLSGADLIGANLIGVDLSEAVLSGADLYGADLGEALLNGADLSDASLSGAEITKEQLAACRSLEGATMPEGQKYEAGFEDKERPQEEGEAPGPS